MNKINITTKFAFTCEDYGSKQLQEDTFFDKHLDSDLNQGL